MAKAKVRSVLTLPTASAAPNGKRIQRAANGQLIILTKSTIYILASFD